MGKANEKNLEFEIKKRGVPHSQPAIEDEMLRLEHAALAVKLYQDYTKPPKFMGIFP